MKSTIGHEPEDSPGAIRRNKRGLVIRGALGVTVVVGVALVLWFTGEGENLWRFFSDRERIQQTVKDTGVLAPVVYVLLLVLQAVVAPLPAPALAMAGGYSFGIFEGFLLTWFGALLGGVACFGLSRLFGRGFVAGRARMGRLDRYVEEHGVLVVFVLRLIPLISFDAISYGAGLSSLSFVRFFLATALGMAPGTLVFVYLGGASPGLGVWAALVSLAVLSIAAYLYFRRNLQRQRRVH
ncbi:MAG: TVP38/TMEM64 family protein [Rubrobacteraceae bacterium]